MRSWVIAALVLGIQCSGAVAQLVSPGPLSSSHAELQGLRQCTACHRLGQRGAAAERCLACHESLAARLREGRGYHARQPAKTCGSCHAEHYGRQFELIRLDTAAFDHGATGHDLNDAHRRTECRACHRPANVTDAGVRAEGGRTLSLERTWLGLEARCGSCHASDDPHDAQFRGKDCGACHGETRWEEAARFDHDRSEYPLTGRHRRVECGGCHREVEGVTRFAGVAFGTCAACHGDVHRGGQGSGCATCHTTTGWRAFAGGFDTSRFDHRRTTFPLSAAHARVACDACHRQPARSDAIIRIRFAQRSSASRFPSILVRDCRSCHVSAHPGSEADRAAGADCAACHGEDGWSPAAFGMREHEATRFPLDGAHMLATCDRCHAPASRGRLEFRRPDIGCEACHAVVNPHGRAYADGAGRTDCARCHGSASWEPTAVRHDAFPLAGAHASTPCAACHAADRASVPRECEACHADPHAGQTADRTCGACHDAATFARAIGFDHETTAFPLTGAHAAAECRACHARLPSRPGAVLIRFKPVPFRCEDCHAS